MEGDKSPLDSEQTELQRTETPSVIVNHENDANESTQPTTPRSPIRAHEGPSREGTTETRTARTRPPLRPSIIPPATNTLSAPDDSHTSPGPTVSARDFGERPSNPRSPSQRDEELEAIPEESRLSLHPSNNASVRSQRSGSFRKRRRGTVATRRGTVASIGPPGGISLAGPSDLPAVAAHQPYVEPGYADLNPAYEQPINSRPVWGLAKPLPRVVRPSMVPQEDEQVPSAGATAGNQASSDSDLEKGQVEPTFNMGKLSNQLRGARERRESNFLQRWGSRNSATDRIGSISAAISPGERPGRLTFSRPGGDIDWDKRHSSYSPRLHIPLNAACSPSHTGHQTYDTEEGQLPDNASTTTTEHDLHDDDKDWLEEELELWPYVPEDEIHNNHTHWSVIRTRFREPFAEFLAVVVQLTLGFCADLTAITSNSVNGNAATNYFAWGFATMLGIYVAGGISGAHLNPAVSLMLWMFRGFPLRKVPGYIFAQVLGAFVAALIAFGIYQDIIISWGGTNLGAGGTAAAFLTYPHSVDVDTAFFTEFVGTAILTIAILALGDDTNAPPGAGMSALIMGLVITVECMAFSNNTGCAMNPSRDFGPRLALLALGYGPNLFQNTWWFYGPWGATLTGAFAGALLYDGLIFVGGESPVNYPRARFKRAEKRWKEEWARKLRFERLRASSKNSTKGTAAANS
ncbi:putative MIP transporter [Phyllosticta citriasiana]|uniref:putative MIP transporter n=1 Tax=Phyllosticta citriasiana TaxID=595635 RepID=UPI0030FD2B01